jgi:uncharacterized protein (TIGR02145 family)
MKKHLILLFLVIFSVCNSFAQTVTIGTQTWTTKNLDVATFRNGDPIPEAKTDEEWKAAVENKQPAWCYYDNKAANGNKYGKLYNWYAVVDARGLAPIGYHIPTDDEWTVLSTFLGGEDVAGKKMKSRSGWNSYKDTCSNCKSWNDESREKKVCDVCKDTRINGKKTFSGNGTNSIGFSGLPVGYRFFKGFNPDGEYGNWWTISESDESSAWGRGLSYSSPVLVRFNYLKYLGFSVRCVKD